MALETLWLVNCRRIATSPNYLISFVILRSRGAFFQVLLRPGELEMTVADCYAPTDAAKTMRRELVAEFAAAPPALSFDGEALPSRLGMASTAFPFDSLGSPV